MAKKKTTKLTASSLAQAIMIIEKEFGDGAIITGNTAIKNVKSFPTGVATLDVALGCGGLPLGRIVELYGPESSGKTTTTLQLIANCQATYLEDAGRYGVACFIDAEHALDRDWAENIGINMEKLLISQPDSGEQALRIVETLAGTNEVDLIVVDSVAALTPQKELDGEIGDSHVGAQARLMSQAMRKLKAVLLKTDTAVVFVNQIREKIGVMFGNPESTPGGRALKFYSSIRIEVRRKSAIKAGEVPIGNMVEAKIVKNKVAPPFKRAEFDIYFGDAAQEPEPTYGIDSEGSLIRIGCELDVLAKSGNFVKFEGISLGNGRAHCAAALRKDPELKKKIETAVYSHISQLRSQTKIEEEESEKELVTVDV